MWQRAQTLYLAVSTALIFALLFCEKAEGITYASYVPYLILLILITLLNVLALTTWKIRVFQFRTTMLSALLTIALQGWLAVDFITTYSDCVFSWTAILPLVAVIFDIMAARGIWADELIVRSSARLRAAKRKK